MKKLLVSVLFICVGLVLSGCLPDSSSPVRGQGLDIILTTSPPSSFSEGASFAVKAKFKNNILGCPMALTGTIDDNTRDSGVEEQQFTLNIPPARIVQKQLRPGEKSVQYDGFNYQGSAYREDLNAMITAKVQYTCTAPVGARAFLCIPELDADDSSDCTIYEEVRGEKLTVDALPIAVTNVAKTFEPSQSGDSMRIRITLKQNILDGHPIYEDERAVAVHVSDINGPEFDCDNEGNGLVVIPWTDRVDEVECVLNDLGNEGVRANIVLDYTFETKEIISVMVINDKKNDNDIIG